MIATKTFLRFEAQNPGLYRSIDGRTFLVLLATGRWAVLRDLVVVAIRATKKEASTWARNAFVSL